MKVKASIFQLIKESAYIPVSIDEKSNLYTDLGFDSLSFIALLTKIEQMHGITFDITEIEMCLQVDNLIRTINYKLKERENSND